MKSFKADTTANKPLTEELERDPKVSVCVHADEMFKCHIRPQTHLNR